jgi:hypothetical protein
MRSGRAKKRKKNSLRLQHRWRMWRRAEDMRYRLTLLRFFGRIDNLLSLGRNTSGTILALFVLFSPRSVSTPTLLDPRPTAAAPAPLLVVALFEARTAESYKGGSATPLPPISIRIVAAGVLVPLVLVTPGSLLDAITAESRSALSLAIYWRVIQVGRAVLV